MINLRKHVNIYKCFLIEKHIKPFHSTKRSTSKLLSLFLHITTNWRSNTTRAAQHQPSAPPSCIQTSGLTNKRLSVWLCCPFLTEHPKWTGSSIHCCLCLNLLQLDLKMQRIWSVFVNSNNRSRQRTLCSDCCCFVSKLQFGIDADFLFLWLQTTLGLF